MHIRWLKYHVGEILTNSDYFAIYISESRNEAIGRSKTKTKQTNKLKQSWNNSIKVWDIYSSL